MVSATMMIVIVTVILGGGLTTPMLGWLQIRSALIWSHSYQWYCLDWNKNIFQMKWWNMGFEDIKVKLLESILIDCFVRFLGIYKMCVIRRLFFFGIVFFLFLVLQSRSGRRKRDDKLCWLLCSEFFGHCLSAS